MDKRTPCIKSWADEVEARREKNKCSCMTLCTNQHFLMARWNADDSMLKTGSCIMCSCQDASVPRRNDGEYPVPVKMLRLN